MGVDDVFCICDDFALCLHKILGLWKYDGLGFRVLLGLIGALGLGVFCGFLYDKHGSLQCRLVLIQGSNASLHRRAAENHSLKPRVDACTHIQT